MTPRILALAISALLFASSAFAVGSVSAQESCNASTIVAADNSFSFSSAPACDAPPPSSLPRGIIQTGPSSNDGNSSYYGGSSASYDFGSSSPSYSPSYGSVCNDGWISSSVGQGTCSWHDGVNYRIGSSSSPSGVTTQPGSTSSGGMWNVAPVAPNAPAGSRGQTGQTATQQAPSQYVIRAY